MYGVNLEKYLRPTFTIDCDHDRVRSCARELTKTCSGEREKVVNLFYFVRDSIRYNMYMISAFEEDFRASRVLKWGKGYCVQKAVLLTALGRAVGIPSRLVFARIRNHKIPPHILEWKKDDVFDGHGYTQFFIDGKWISAAPTFDKRLCDSLGVPAAEFDGKSDAVLPEKDLQGAPYIKYLEKYTHYDDLPFEWIRKRTVEAWGEEKRPWLEPAHSSVK